MFMSSKVSGSRLVAVLSVPMYIGATFLSVTLGTLITSAAFLGTSGSFLSEYLARVFLSSQYFSVGSPYSFIGAS